jgi:hypothetical protein
MKTTRMTTAQSERIQALTQEVSKSKFNPEQKREKKKRKKEKKRAADSSQAEAKAEQDPAHAPRPGKKRQRKLNHLKKQSSPFECMLLCAENAKFTGSVIFPSSITRSLDEEPQSKQQQIQAPPESSPLSSNKNRTVHVQTSCTLQLQLPPDSEGTASATSATTITSSPTTNSCSLLQVQPLLILDLNGILCHRIRSRRTPPTNSTSTASATVFRPFITRIAGTPVVPRTDLHDMLHYLDRHFCLAVWTSAKAKSAKQLVAALIPPAVAARLLFVWAQHDCETVISNNNTSTGSGCDDSDDDNSSIFKKDLSKVWKEYPVWNASNTLLMDDSPDKCVAWRENAVHPPPLNGLAGTTQDDDNDDEINARQQRLFLEQFVQHWNDEHAVLQIWDEMTGDATVTNNADGQLQFLKRQAIGHMGWSIT